MNKYGRVSVRNTNEERNNNMIQDWKMPDISIIHLSNGEVVDAEVNGKSLDGQSGYVYWGRGIQVERIDDDTWMERGASMVNMDLHWSDS